MTDRESYVALNMLPKIGPVRVRRLIESLGGPEQVLSATHSRLQVVDGIGPEIAKIIHDWESRIDLAEEIREANQRGIEVVTLADETYPAALRHLYDPPLVLYVWGDLQERDRHALGIVGSRKCSHYGTQCSRQFAFQLAASGMTVVSGLARGIDTHAHEGAIAAKGRTIAVIGSGLGQVYPPENMGLAEKIASGFGAVVSEFPLHTAPSKKTFPMRNRIVAGWSQAMVVVECPAWSGALITANLAGEMGKPVYAVPGQIDRPSSAGCNRLIRDGAILVTGGQDILDDFQMLPVADSIQVGCGSTSEKPDRSGEATSRGADLPMSDDEQAILQVLDQDPMLMDQLLEETGLALPTLNATLLKLEMTGRLRQFPGGRIGRK
ncbi:DNA-protecting protein DprA [Verrucomicrobiaceae bacterium N1E253]|uniref:DNA-protecting protein DprA n=2 Tax=Oceaniferula marina TaxID=2748318 RepID=A0A851GDH8_9BACT|nr:DNA-protecting protein DprA [Oceaniferula marina]